VTTRSRSETIHEQGQTALFSLNFRHPDGAVTELEAVLERIGPDSPYAAVIQRAIDWLKEIAVEITKVEGLLCEHDFTFGKLEK
jgi:hypothetical protein